MSLSEYFENIKGVGILATSDSDGKVRHLIYFSVDRTRPLVGDKT